MRLWDNAPVRRQGLYPDSDDEVESPRSTHGLGQGLVLQARFGCLRSAAPKAAEESAEEGGSLSWV